jgi:hypothetical protein
MSKGFNIHVECIARVFPRSQKSAISVGILRIHDTITNSSAHRFAKLLYL